MVDSIINHQGKGANCEFKIKWKAGDETWAPYCEVAYLMALNRYCEIMGVSDPCDLPAKQDEQPHGTQVIISSMKLRDVPRYISSLEERVRVNIPEMSSPCISREDASACSAYV